MHPALELAAIYHDAVDTHGAVSLQAWAIQDEIDAQVDVAYVKFRVSRRVDRPNIKTAIRDEAEVLHPELVDYDEYEDYDDARAAIAALTDAERREAISREVARCVCVVKNRDWLAWQRGGAWASLTSFDSILKEQYSDARVQQLANSDGIEMRIRSYANLINQSPGNAVINGVEENPE